jgi:hypothetical protein
MREGLIAWPERVYSPIVPFPEFDTNRWPFPSIANPSGPLKPLMSEALIVAPERAYSPMVPVRQLATKIWLFADKVPQLIKTSQTIRCACRFFVIEQAQFITQFKSVKRKRLSDNQQGTS